MVRCWVRESNLGRQETPIAFCIWPVMSQCLQHIIVLPKQYTLFVPCNLPYLRCLRMRVHTHGRVTNAGEDPPHIFVLMPLSIVMLSINNFPFLPRIDHIRPHSEWYAICHYSSVSAI